MTFNRHSSQLLTRHAFLSPSNPAWVNYDEDKFDRVFFAQELAAKGTRLHALACSLIKEGVKLPDNKKTLSMYVNDAIGFKMTPEIILYYSDNCFGTPDTVGYNHRKKLLRIHDLKTGLTPATMTQLKIYAALFCLEYNMSPRDIAVELRIYQNDAIEVLTPEPTDTIQLMKRIEFFDKRIEFLKEAAQ